MPEYFSEDFLADIELLPVYNLRSKWFLKELVLPFFIGNTQVFALRYLEFGQN